MFGNSTNVGRHLNMLGKHKDVRRRTKSVGKIYKVGKYKTLRKLNMFEKKKLKCLGNN